MAMGSGQGFLGLLLLMIPMFILRLSSPATAYKFYVGGHDGWVLKPSEKYNHWAEKTRFQVNDTLYFNYKVGSDSVLVVEEADYNSCNTERPIHRMDDGDSEFRLDRSGPFYFISGNVKHCRHGQKLIVVVLAIRHNKPSHESLSPPPATPPSQAPPPAIPSSQAPSPAASGWPTTTVPSSSPSEGPAVAYSPAPSPSQHSGSTKFGGSVVGVAMGFAVGVVLLSFA